VGEAEINIPAMLQHNQGLNRTGTRRKTRGEQEKNTTKRERGEK
jgi:hypothetical protein